MSDTSPDLLHALATGARNGAELQARLGVSQPTVSRLVRAAGNEVIVIGRARATHYARRRRIPEVGDDLPLYRIDPQGDVHRFGHLYPLVAGEFACAFEGQASVLHPGLPWFLQDMRPQGFMGRAFARHFATSLNLPGRLPDWDDDAHLIAMALYGEDLAGNLIVGDASLERFYRRALAGDAIPEAGRAAAYPRLAEAFLDEQPGSSAGGEQPKFTARLATPGGGIRSVIVKFSPTGNDAAAVRWRDLLRAEQAALAWLREQGIPAAASQLVEAGGRLFLEVERFDRVGERGRRGLLSLAAIDDHHFGLRGNWSAMAARLQQQRMVTPGEARTMRLLDVFGALIANSDRHFGNLSLFVDDFTHALAPAYDLLPMACRPTDQGEVRAPDFLPPLPSAANADVWDEALALAREYWRRLTDLPALSADFRAIAAGNARRLASLEAIRPPQ
ncbi:MAG: hypothetical protein K0Q68_321 [Moraxellaceae bacterium]|jgi:hypothetical protein|nr:hypothetical protein [Moraxellaceae bacterium]